MPSKDKLRKKFIFLRKKKYFLVKKDFFKPILKILKKKKLKNISLYYPSNFEVDTSSLFNILKKKKSITTSLPKILPSGRMKFVVWNFFDPLKINKFGFLEPTNYNNIATPEIMIIPLVAFDEFRNRLGYGKGYYDKFLARQIKGKKSILTIGLAFSFQKYKKIPTTKSDMKLDHILTEKGIF